MQNSEALEQLEKKIKSILDSDLGDYKRKCQLYINNFKGQINTNSTQLKVLIGKLDQFISFDYEQDIDMVQIKIQESIEEIRSQLKK
ncbi:MAG: hypothetical protein VX642_01905 [Bdellovibrionota bacterium]|nr:hypothetical protein [Bdellovibrionota bacterium]